MDTGCCQLANRPHASLSHPWFSLLTLSSWGARLGSWPPEVAFFVFLLGEGCSGEAGAAGERGARSFTWSKGPQK